MHQDDRYVRWFETLNNTDVPLVGGKNASLGEMVRTLKDQGIPVPHGFATTAAAYWEFLKANDLSGKIEARLKDWRQGAKSLEETGKAIRRLFLRAQYPQEIAAAISIAYHELSRRYNVNDVDVAVRSSATAEDLPDASFAGQQESFLNVTGDHELMEACRRCYASLFTDRAMIYRQEKGFDHLRVALSIGVQKMVRSDKAGSGVMFTIDTETGFRDAAVINAAWGLGENVVQGTVNPDEYMVFKPLLANPGFIPIIEKNLGAKEKKLVYAVGGTKTTRNLDTARDERNTFVLVRRRDFDPGPLGGHYRSSITASPWTSNGPRMATPAGYSSSRPARKPSNPAGKPATSKPMRCSKRAKGCSPAWPSGRPLPPGGSAASRAPRILPGSRMTPFWSPK